jgi:predicted ester cyclase
MSKDENKEIVRRWVEARNTNDLDAALAVWVEEAHPPLRKGFQYFSQTFADIYLKIEDIFCEGDKVALRWTLNAIHTGVFQGIPATEKKITMIGIDIYTIENGKIKSIIRRTDDLGLLKQMGVTLSWQGEVIS